MTEQRKSRFKPVQVSTNKQAADEAKEQAYRGSGRAGFLSINEGKNIFRIAPPHDADSHPSLEPMSRVWLPRYVEIEGKGGKKVQEIKDYPVFNAKVHSPLQRDIVDEYITFATKTLNDELGKEAAKKKLAPITGYRDKSGKWVRGLSSGLSFIGYAWDKDGKFGRLELSKTIVDRMNDLSIDEDSDETISVDPFSDPENGVSLIITYDKSEEAAKKYKVSKGSRQTALTEEQEDQLFEADPLAEMFRNSYTKTDFDHQLEGLRIFDERNRFGFMDMEEFIVICEEIADLIDQCPDIKESDESPDDDDADDKGTTTSNRETASRSASRPEKPINLNKAPTRNAPVKQEIHADNEDDDGLDDLTVDELKEYITDMELSVVVKPAYTKSKIIRDIRAARDGAVDEKPDILEDHDDNGESDDLPFEKADGATVNTSTGTKSSAQSRLDELRKRRNK